MTPTVVMFARVTCGERALDRMPKLADALEALAGTEAEILGRCRSKTSHVRGCWVVDTLLANA